MSPKSVRDLQTVSSGVTKAPEMALGHAGRWLRLAPCWVPRSFLPQHNPTGNNFPYTFMGLNPGTTKAEVRKALEDWNKGDNGILDLSQAFRLKPGSGWLIGPSILHAPGSLCTYEPQWGSDVFGMYQSLVEGREVPWALLVKDMPREKHRDLEFIVDQLDWEANVDPHFKENHYLEPKLHHGSLKA